MKRSIRILTVLMTLLLLFPVFFSTAHANSAEPPCFTILVSNPPEDLTLSVRLTSEDGQKSEVTLTSHRKAWETYYRLFYHMLPDFTEKGNEALEGTVLIVSSDRKSFECPLPADAFKFYNNLMTLDLRSETLTVGQPAYRVPLLTAMRVILTLLIEGLVFYLFRYREKRSWILFLVVNLITQIGLNTQFSGPSTSGYWVISYLFLEILIFITEAILFCCFAKEKKKLRGFLYAITANLASLLLGGYLIGHLPI